MAKAGKKRQNTSQVPQSKKVKHVPESKTRPAIHKDDPEIGKEFDGELEMEAMLDEFAKQTRSSALEEALREMKEDSDEENSDAMSEDDKISDSEEEEIDERIEETTTTTAATPDKPAGKPTFRDHYMTKVTQAFGTDLDRIRQEPSFNASQLTLLINSLEAGVDIFSDLEQEIIMQQE